jgi:alkanesulfonate monooxygenase SsuD/methylene tetrahydromethanopterin reductase-like flavin-dependent oxidoreductase (luciferase family)
MKVGLMLPQVPGDGGGTWAEILALARQAEAGGADSLWVCDHFLHRPGDRPEVGLHEAWTLLAAVAASTTAVELGPLVLATSFRPPALLAKMAATLDDIAGGRLVLGLGCGWHEPEYLAFGYPFDHRVGRFEEAIRIVRPLLRGERVTFEGAWNQVQDAVLLPPPRRGTIPIVVAAKGDRMLGITAAHADGWQAAWFGLPDDRFERDRERLADACRVAGRPDSPEILVGVEVNDDDDAGAARLPVDAGAIEEALVAWAATGAGHVQLGVWPASPASFGIALDGMARFKARERPRLTGK